MWLEKSYFSLETSVCPLPSLSWILNIFHYQRFFCFFFCFMFCRESRETSVFFPPPTSNHFLDQNKKAKNWFCFLFPDFRPRIINVSLQTFTPSNKWRRREECPFVKRLNHLLFGPKQKYVHCLYKSQNKTRFLCLQPRKSSVCV